LVEYQNDGTVIPEELGKGVSAVTVPNSDGYETGIKHFHG
jgi:hypothetical protein